MGRAGRPRVTAATPVTQGRRLDLVPVRCARCARSDNVAELFRIPAALSCQISELSRLPPSGEVTASGKCRTCGTVWAVVTFR